MYDLSNVGHFRQGSQTSLKAVSSEANLRTNFANGSMTSLLAPGGYVSRPATSASTSRTKPWVNPLDVHFQKPITAPPKSPLANVEMGSSMGDKAAEARSSLFGANAEDVAQAIMVSVEQKEEELAKKERESIGRVEKEREERERRQKQQEEIERLQREQERLEVQRRKTQLEAEKQRAAVAAEKQLEAEKQRAAVAAASAAVPVAVPAFDAPTRGLPRLPGPPSPARAGHGPLRGPMNRGQLNHQSNSNWSGPPERPTFHGQAEIRPGSRNGAQHRPLDRPQYQGQAQGHQDFRPGSRAGQNERPRFQGQPMDHRPGSRNGQYDRPGFQAQGQGHGQLDHRGGGSRNGHRGHTDRYVVQGQIDQRPGSRNGQQRQLPPDGQTSGPMQPRHMDSVAIRGPMPGPGPTRLRGPMPGPADDYNEGLRPAPLTDGTDQAIDPHRQHEQNPFAPAALPSPPAHQMQSSHDHFGHLDGKPVIRNVQARRDTLTLNTPRRSSLAMTIEAFERSIMDAQRGAGQPFDDNGSIHDSGSDASSHYSIDDRAESPTYPLPPSPHRRPSPPYTTTDARSESPMTRPMPGKGVQRPDPGEYGVVSVRTSPESKLPQGVTRRNGVDHSNSPVSPSPPRIIADTSMEPAPLFRVPKWSNNDPYDNPVYAGDFSQPRPVPTPNPKSDLSLNFTGPPTPDSTHNWPLPSPMPASIAPQLKRTNLPAPLKFDFSPNGYSRDNSGLYTPPVQRMMPRSPAFLDEDPRPSTSHGLGIGIARGLSVRETRGVVGVERRPDFGLNAPTGIADDFGTPLI